MAQTIFNQVIDRKTLDLYNAEEAKWGRSPNDPFTGKLFSHNSRFAFYKPLDHGFCNL